MAVTATSEMQGVIKRYKKLLESEELFQYAYKPGETRYYYVTYARFGKTTGSIILSDDPASKRSELLEADQAFFHFNRVLQEAGTQLVKDIQRPTELLEKLKQQLRQAEWKQEFGLKPFEEDIYRLYQALDLGIGVKDKLHAIFLKMQALEKEVRERGYFSESELELMIGWNLEHYRIMYEQGREMIAVLPVMDRLKGHLAGLQGTVADENEKLRQSLWTGLDALTTDKNVKVLMASNATFEQDAAGKRIAMKENEEGLQQFEEESRAVVEALYRNTIKEIRNL